MLLSPGDMSNKTDVASNPDTLFECLYFLKFTQGQRQGFLLANSMYPPEPSYRNTFSRYDIAEQMLKVMINTNNHSHTVVRFRVLV